MAYFEQAFVDFFAQLTANNNRDWFQTHKKEYEEEVKAPFLALIGDLLKALSKDWDSEPTQPKDYMMRIYRDVRFSKDKSPYKTHMAAHLSPYGRKEMGRPGLFFHANHRGIEIFSGLYMIAKDDLTRIRQAIADDLPSFHKLVQAKRFRETFGEILGEKNKRIPAEFKEAAEQEPLIANKQFYYKSVLDPSWLFEANLAKEMVKRYQAAAEINAFFDDALPN